MAKLRWHPVFTMSKKNSWRHTMSQQQHNTIDTFCSNKKKQNRDNSKTRNTTQEAARCDCSNMFISYWLFMRTKNNKPVGDWAGALLGLMRQSRINKHFRNDGKKKIIDRHVSVTYVYSTSHK